MNFLRKEYNNVMYVLYAIFLACVSVYTGEIITFIMLGFVFMALLNINTTLRKILEKMDKQTNPGMNPNDSKQPQQLENDEAAD